MFDILVYVFAGFGILSVLFLLFVLLLFLSIESLSTRRESSAEKKSSEQSVIPAMMETPAMIKSESIIKTSEMKEVRNILVIDDEEKNLDMARLQFPNAIVTECSSYKEGRSLLRGDRTRVAERAKILKAEGVEHFSAFNIAEKEVVRSTFDVLFVDLRLPASDEALVGDAKQMAGQIMSVGWTLALQAAKNGVKYIVLLTDIGHHNHPESAALDELRYHTFRIDESLVCFDQADLVNTNTIEGGKDWKSAFESFSRDDLLC